MVNVRLLPIQSNLAESLRIGSQHFRQQYGARVAAEVRDVVEQILDMYARSPRDATRDARWGGYLAMDEAKDLIVGTCAFKGPPMEGATIEIAYYTFGPYEGQGYAKSMARALISVALSSHLVRRVIAHTLPESNPSTSVLQSVGMSFVGKVEDPVDGPVWRWQLGSGD